MLTKYEIEEEEFKPTEIRIDTNNITVHGLGIDTSWNEQGFTITRTEIPNPVYVDYYGVHDVPIIEPIEYSPPTYYASI